jgi:hypothetical protein
VCEWGVGIGVLDARVFGCKEVIVSAFDSAR